MMTITRIATIPITLTLLIPPSIIFTLYSAKRSLRELQKPIVFIDADTALAKAKITPTDAPNSGPKDLEIM